MALTLKKFTDFILSFAVAVADSTPSVISTPQLTKDMAPSVKVEMSEVINKTPTIVSPAHISPTVTSTSTTPVMMPQTSALPSSKAKKRKADTTTPGNLPSEQPPVSKAAKIPARRGSTRPIKKPIRELPELPNQVINRIYTGKMLMKKSLYS